MRSILNFRNSLIATVVVIGLSIAAGDAAATDHCGPDCYYKTVIVYESVLEPTVHWVTKHDHCGKPYRVRVVKHKLVQVPVEKRVKICR